mmetsp:Transcript_7415/g.13835  ORF Transcript_7415/g.13835 Transcript_7415/m.13835 type:complete len:106 (+) Transcript_7415:197-514(+)
MHLGPLMEAEKGEITNRAKFEKYKVILATFPETNRSLLRFLMGFLNEVHQNAEVNMMEAKNLATCWTPSLIFHQQQETTDQPIDVEFLKALSGPGARLSAETLIR